MTRNPFCLWGAVCLVHMPCRSFDLRRPSFPGRRTLDTEPQMGCTWHPARRMEDQSMRCMQICLHWVPDLYCSSHRPFAPRWPSCQGRCTVYTQVHRGSHGLDHTENTDSSLDRRSQPARSGSSIQDRTDLYSLSSELRKCHLGTPYMGLLGRSLDQQTWRRRHRRELPLRPASLRQVCMLSTSSSGSG